MRRICWATKPPNEKLGQRKALRCLCEHVLGHRLQGLATGLVAYCAVGDVGQVGQLRAPQLGIVEQAGQQQQGNTVGHGVLSRQHGDGTMPQQAVAL